MDVAKDDATRALLRAAPVTVPPDMAALLRRVSLASFGPALCDTLGVASVADVQLLTEADFERQLPAMKLAERRRLLKAAADAA